jgi:hypothetical protein
MKSGTVFQGTSRVGAAASLVLVVTVLSACVGDLGNEGGGGSNASGEGAQGPATGGRNAAGTGQSGATNGSGNGTGATGATGATGNTATATGSTSTDSTSSSSSTGSGGAPPLPPNACDGYATRYWDCCKAHCGWDGNVPDPVSPVTSCSQNDTPQTGNYDAQSACNSAQSNSSYTCFSMAPWAVNDVLSYGFSAVPPVNGNDICGRCYQLHFSGTSHNAGDDPGSMALAGKVMIVQATNIGYDVQGHQFDLLTPGGGVGAFNACSTQWGTSNLGAQYGGFLTACKQEGNDTLAELKTCVLARCDDVFAGASFSELKAGCHWFVDWFEVADNPNLQYAEVPCPSGIIAVSGVDRGPLNDIQDCQ